MKFFIDFLIIMGSLLFVLPDSLNAQRNDQFQPNKIEICLNSEINSISNPNLISDFRFQPIGTVELNKRSKYWLCITIKNNALNETKNYLHFNNIFAEVILWQKGENNLWEQISIGGYDIPYSKRTGKGIIDDKLFFSASHGNATQLLVLANQPHRNIIYKNQCEIISESNFVKKNTFSNNLQFWLAGIISFLFLFSLILFIFLHNRAFIIYASYSIITEIYFLAYFNIIEANLLFNYPQISKYFFFCITLSQSLYFLFLNDLLKPINNIKKKKFVTKYAIISFSTALLIIALSLFRFSLGVKLSDIYSIINGGVGLYIIAITYKEVPKRVGIVYTGFVSILFGGLLALFLNSISHGNAFIYIYQLGFLIELAFFFIAISYTYFIEKTSRIQTMLNLSLLETKKLKTEKEALALKNEVNQKNRKLTSKAVEISKNNQLINKMIDSLELLENKGTVSINDIARLKKSLINTAKLDYWEEFEAHFIQVHPDFYEVLNKKYPELTTTERRLCAFIKLNLSTKEIANITKRNPESIHMTRSRLRKKMGLDKTANLENIIASIH